MLTWRRRAGWFALFVPTLWLTISAIRGDQSIYQARPASSWHRTIQQDCQACHTEAFQTTRQLLLAGREYGHYVEKQTCRNCHPQDRYDHQPLLAISAQSEQDSGVLIAADVFRCADCHREHTGRDDLIRVADSFCVHCHEELQTTAGTSVTFASQVVDFATHPQFAFLRSQVVDDVTLPGPDHGVRDVAVLPTEDVAGIPPQWRDRTTLIFPHDVHLKTEGVLVPSTHPAAQGARGKTLALSCADCHTPADDGRYMQPINFEQHCQACHPLSVSSHAGGPLPHEQTALIEGVLRQRLFDQYETRHAEEPPRLPNVDHEPAARDRWTWVEEQLQQTETTPDGRRTVPQLVELACRYCHAVEQRAAPSPTSVLTFDVVPPQIPDRWMRHAVFRHDKHDAETMQCVDCHDASSSKSSGDIILPPIASCQKCHRSRGLIDTVWGARDDCVECHQFHHKRRPSPAVAPGPFVRPERESGS
ncbi:MAG: cytochrome c3 family protein [Planctomycetales bacterium]|nr:cytochrome c3 family protein [Planctomycetales bacterium]